MARKSPWRPAAVAWRVLFGRNGPTKRAMRKAWREWTDPREKASIRLDPKTGKPRASGVRQRKDGTWEAKPRRRRASK